MQNAKKTIVVFTNEFPPGPGGIGEHAYQISKQFFELGYNIKVVTSQDFVETSTRDDFNSQLGFKIETLTRNLPAPLYQIKNAIQFFNICKNYRPSFIFTSGAVPTMLSTFAERFLGIKKITFVHGPEYQRIFSGIPFIAKFILSKATIIAVSNYTKQFVEKFYPNKVIHVVNNGAKIPKWDSSFKNGVDQDDRFLTILTVGRMYPRKGQDVVIKSLPEVLTKFPKTQYLIVGQEDEKIKLASLAKELKVEKSVKFIGKVPLDQLGNYYKACDVYVLASQTLNDGDFEGFGISIIEAAFMGKPAIGTNNSGIEDAIVDGKTGLLVDRSSPSQTAEAIIKLLSDSSLRDKMGKQAKERAKSFTWNIAAEKVDSIIND